MPFTSLPPTPPPRRVENARRTMRGGEGRKLTLPRRRKTRRHDFFSVGFAQAIDKSHAEAQRRPSALQAVLVIA